MNIEGSGRRKRARSEDNFRKSDSPFENIEVEVCVKNDDIVFALKYGPPKKKKKLTEIVNKLNEYASSIKQNVTARKNRDRTCSITGSSKPFFVRNESAKISLQEITNERNSKKTYCDENGYMYSVNSRTKGAIYLSCKNAKRLNCNGRVNLKNGNWEEAEVTKMHTHAPDQKILDYIKFQKKLEEIIRQNPFLKPLSCYNMTKRALKDQIQRKHIPELSQLNTFIHRLIKDDIPLHPKTIDEFLELINEAQNFERFGTDVRGQPLFRGVLRGRTGNNVLFVSESILRMVNKKRRVKILSDGTFKALPRHLKFQQLYIINVLIGKRAYPLAYILMERRDCESYEIIFNKIKSMIPTVRVVEGMTDYEAATRKAFKKVFPKARRAGCYFHYVQAINKAFRRHGLKKDEKFKRARQKVVALALLPNEFILNGFNEISKHFKGSIRWARFKEYWLRQWHNPKNNANISVYRLRNRSNNFSESLNRTLNSLGKRPHIWQLIYNIQSIDMNKSDELDNIDDGLIIKTRKSQDMKSLNKKIESATKEFEKHLNVGKFLRQVTFNENYETYHQDRIHIDEVDTEDEIDDEEYDETIIPNSFSRKSNYRRIPRGQGIRVIHKKNLSLTTHIGVQKYPNCL